MDYQQNKIKKNAYLVFFVPSLSGGIGKVTLSLAKGMSKHKINVEIWALNNGEYDSIVSEYAKVLHLKALRAIKALPQIMQLLKTKRPDVLLSASFHLNVVAVMAKMLTRVRTRIFLAEHTSLDAGLKSLPPITRIIALITIRLFYKRANGIIAVSEGVAEQVAKFASVNKKDITVIYNPVISDELFEQSKAKVSHPFFNSNKKILLAVGRLSKEKDYETLLKAFAILNKKIPSLLIILGEGPERKNLKQLIETLGIVENVSMPGRVENPYPYFLKADVYVLSSIREGLSNTLIEALALGIKAVSTNAKSGPREVLKNGLYGELVPISNSDKLAQVIYRTLHSKNKVIPENALTQYKDTIAVDFYIKFLKINN